MRRLLSALVGMAGLAAAGLFILMVLNDKILNAAITFTVIGQIPGTNTQLNFMSSVVSGTTILALGIAGAILYRRYTLKDFTLQSSATSTSGTPDDPSEPFDGEDIIMVADDMQDIFDDLVSRHQSLPVQLQLF